MSGKEIVVHSLAHAQAALAAAAEARVPVTLASAPHAGVQAGPGWFKAVIDEARAAHPEVAVTAILDCSDDAGAVMAALRLGLKHLRFGGPEPVRLKLASMGAVFAEPPGEVLDLDAARDGQARCREFLIRP